MPDGPGNTGWQSPFTESVVDQKVVRAKRLRTALVVVAVIAAVAFAAGWNPPTGTVHKFTKASDYKPEKESGCTNSGKGCHGQEKSYRDFNVYHPDSECTTCHDYQGVGCIPCHMPPEQECPLCHDGSLKQAPDVTKLTDPYPRGHYRETTHTAMGTPMDDEVRISADGRASATCEDCHSRDLRDAHTKVPTVAGSDYGTDIGCGECHNDVRSNGLAEVLSDWKGRRCDDCHKTGSSSPQHASDQVAEVDAESPLGCGTTGAGCHDVTDLHAIHEDKPRTCAGSAARGEKGCHVIGAEAAKPTAVTCGGSEDDACHLLYANDAYSHKRDADVHSPTTNGPAQDTSFYEIPCGECHRMAPDGTSLTDEHSLATSARSNDAANVCTNCHNLAVSVDVVEAGWPDRNTGSSCTSCHGADGLSAPHEGNLTVKHDVTSVGCSDSGAGCHPTSDLMAVGEPNTTTNIHRDCLRCHEWAQSDGNLAYDPAKTTCGSGRDCHAAAGAYSIASSVHNGAAGLANGSDSAHHVAGSKQLYGTWTDSASGVTASCYACHSMTLGTEHTRPDSSLKTGSGTTCARCHNADATASKLVKSSWPEKSTTSACSACHKGDGPRQIHGAIGSTHGGVELAADGSGQTGSCVRGGCHKTLDLRVIHADQGCTARGCHQNSGSITESGLKSCGGSNPDTACHAGYSSDQHFAKHLANLTGTVNGVTYSTGRNEGCFGCHVSDLAVEHENARQAGVLEGGGSSSCAICHADMSGAGDYAAVADVKRAIAGHDVRCDSCHNGGDGDSASGVSSPHREVSTDDPLPSGKVWADPAGEWKAAYDAVTGGGHNGLPRSLTGGAKDKRFPLTAFSIDATEYVWALPPNTGDTTWLKGPGLPAGSTDSTDAIREIQVDCDDCHMLPAGMDGPHGSAVPIAIDDEYSQTEYANPTRTTSQFEATGTQRVVCFKCHPIFVGGVDGSSAPGGATLHSRHVSHPDLPLSDKRRNGETCIDCHVRIPHAWKRPRLLIRSVSTTDGVVPDAFPYVAEDHDGLLGIRLRSFDPQSQLRSGSCVTGGCHPASSPTRHPRPSDVPTATYWP